MTGSARHDGPNRGRSNASGGTGASAVDLFEELDQFVDSEPVDWASREPVSARAHSAAPPPERYRTPPAAPAQSADRAPAGDRDAAFIRSGATRSRREAFQQRLIEELDRKPDRRSQDPPVDGLADAGKARGSRPDMVPEGPAHPSGGRAALRTDLGRPGAAAAARGAADADTPASTKAARPPLPDVAEDSPANALEWELDNAIGAIIANNQKSGDGDGPASALERPAPIADQLARDSNVPSMAPGNAPATAPSRALTQLPALSVPRPADLAPRVPEAADPALPARPLTTIKRAKPIPSFKFDRRDEGEEPGAETRPDMDDPLSNIFFQDVRDQFDAVRRRDADAVDEHVGAITELGPDELDDEYHADDTDPDRLPPSLQRAARPSGLFERSVVGLAVAAAGVCALVVAVFVGLNGFAGDNDQQADIPVIRADAQDVKVRPEATGLAAEPDITERTRLGDSEALVMPDRVDLQGQGAAPPTGDDEENQLISRRVRTVAVRPDGTIVSADSRVGGASQAWGGETDGTQGGEDFALLDSEDDQSAGGLEPADRFDTPEPNMPELNTPQSNTLQSGADGATRGVDVASFEPLEAEPRLTSVPEAQEAEADDGEGFAEPALEADDGAAPSAAAIPRRRPAPPPRRAAQASAQGTQVANARTGADGAPLSLVERPPETPPAVASQTIAGAATSSAWGVQISSQRSQADAQRSLDNIRRRYPTILAGLQPMIVPVDLGDRGRFYRVRLATNSRGEAASLCQRLKAEGADCFIGRN